MKRILNWFLRRKRSICCLIAMCLLLLVFLNYYQNVMTDMFTRSQVNKDDDVMRRVIMDYEETIQNVKSLVTLEKGDIASLESNDGSEKWGKMWNHVIDSLPDDQNYLPVELKIELSKITLKTQMQKTNKECGMTDFLDNWAQYYDTYIPTYSCELNFRLGGYGDGGKVICDPYKFSGMQERIGRKCAVFSFGSNNDFRFEHAIRSMLGCVIHTFDPTCNGPADHHHQWGLGPCLPETYMPKKSDWEGKPEVWYWNNQIGNDFICVSLSGAAKNLGFKTIDILKMDVEGHERSWILHMLDKEPTILQDLGVKIIMMEYHPHADRSCGEVREFLLATILAFNELGYHMYYYEFNILSGCGAEYSFAHESFFKSNRILK